MKAKIQYTDEFEVEIHKLAKHPQNDFPDTPSDEFKKLCESIKIHGLFHGILIDQRYRILSGNQRVRAAQSLGMKMIAAKMLKSLISGKEVRKIIIEANLNQRQLSKQAFREYWFELYGEYTMEEIEKGTPISQIAAGISEANGVAKHRNTAQVRRLYKTAVKDRMDKKVEHIKNGRLDTDSGMIALSETARQKIKTNIRLCERLRVDIESKVREYNAARSEMQSIVNAAIHRTPRIDIRTRDTLSKFTLYSGVEELWVSVVKE